MEKAILKTLIYADIFEFPLKAWEIHKWLIGKKTTLRQIEEVLTGLINIKKINTKKGYYFLPGKDRFVAKRLIRQKQSARYLRKAEFLVQILKLIPWIKLVGVSGGLAMDNAGREDDIDLIVITAKNRLWISRILTLCLFSLTTQRRRVGEKGRKIAGKLCLNMLLEEDRLSQKNKDIYLAHEVLQMKVLWERDGIYGKYLENNLWAFKLLPNWIGNSWEQAKKEEDQQNTILDVFENLAKRFQLKIMQEPKGMERIGNGALYFHPNDIRQDILVKYKLKISRA